MGKRKFLDPIEKLKPATVWIAMGSDSDWNIMKGAQAVLSQFKVSCKAYVVSAHRTPNWLQQFAAQAEQRDVKIIIAGAGGAAHLPGMLAAFGTVPVLGVPIAVGALNGMDALYSIVQMPKGVPVATFAIGGAENAALYAVQILALENAELKRKVFEFRKGQTEKVYACDLES